MAHPYLKVRTKQKWIESSKHLRIPPSPTVWACGFSRGSVNKAHLKYGNIEKIVNFFILGPITKTGGDGMKHMSVRRKIQALIATAVVAML